MLSIEPLNPPITNSEPLSQPDSPYAMETDADTCALILSWNGSFTNTSNTSFNTAIGNSDESITEIINETLDEYKMKIDSYFVYKWEHD